MTYPQTPGHRPHATGGTSEAAARAVTPKAPTLREQVLAAIAEGGPMTPEQALGRLTLMGTRTVLNTVRARCTELAIAGALVDSGLRGQSEGGKSAIKWEATRQSLSTP